MLPYWENGMPPKPLSRLAISKMWQESAEVSDTLASMLPSHFSMIMYSHPTLLSEDASQASTFGTGAPMRDRTKSIVATSLRVRRLRGPALRNGIRATTSFPVSRLRRNTRLNVPGKNWARLPREQKSKDLLLQLQSRCIQRHHMLSRQLLREPLRRNRVVLKPFLLDHQRLRRTKSDPGTLTFVVVVQPASRSTCHKQLWAHRIGRVCRHEAS